MTAQSDSKSPYAIFEKLIAQEAVVEAAEKDLQDFADILKKLTVFATIVFFDLVGSTRYRRSHGSVRALKKSQLHNALVSKAVLECNGEIVKWLGDGVMAKFLASDANVGVGHQWSAVEASLKALRELANYNGRLKRRLGDGSWEEEIHTKIGISTGDVHLWTVEMEGKDQPVTELDPIGSTCDLAARLGGLGAEDVILIDDKTFFVGWNGLSDETEADDRKCENRLGARPISPTQPHSLKWGTPGGWRELVLEKERETTYPPRWLPFGVKGFSLHPLQINWGDTLFLKEKEFKEAAEKNSDGYKDVVFCGEPIECNVRGFPGRVGAIPIALFPMPRPVKQQIYDSPSSKIIEDALKRADGFHRSGNHREAEKVYRQVLGLDGEKLLGVNCDPLDFRANVRMAQYCRHSRDLNGAQSHWNEAKKSNPLNPHIWALAGTTHLEFYINWLGGESDLSESAAKQHQSRAITGLTRARTLAGDAFDAALEQYSTCYLVIAHSLRRYELDMQNARLLLHELDSWVSQNPDLARLKLLADVFYYIAGGERDYIHASRILSELEREAAAPATIEGPELRRDAILEMEDFHVLVKLARFRLDTARRQKASSLAAHASNASLLGAKVIK